MVMANLVQKELLQGSAVDKALENGALKAGITQVVHPNRCSDPPFALNVGIRIIECEISHTCQTRSSKARVGFPYRFDCLELQSISHSVTQ
jgi:hypothetical protein